MHEIVRRRQSDANAESLVYRGDERGVAGLRHESLPDLERLVGVGSLLRHLRWWYQGECLPRFVLSGVKLI